MFVPTQISIEKREDEMLRGSLAHDELPQPSAVHRAAQDGSPFWFKLSRADHKTSDRRGDRLFARQRGSHRYEEALS